MKKYKYLFLILCPLLLILISSILMAKYNDRIGLLLVMQPIVSIIIVYAFFLFFSFVFHSFKKANYILIIFFFLLLTINQIKIFYMQEPLFLSDILLLGGMDEVLSITNGTLINFFYKYGVLLLVQTLLFSLLFYYTYRINEPPNKRHYFGLIPFLIFAFLSLPFKWSTSLMQRVFFSFNDYSALTNNVDNCIYYGIIGNIYRNMLDNRIFIPDNYDEEEIQKILNFEKNDKNNTEKMNIIFLFSESFFDMNKVKDSISFSDNFLKEYQELKEKNKTIQMLSPTYGGMSSNVEFELLTGFNLAYYNKGYIPYLSLVDNKFYERENLLSILSNNAFKNYVFYAYDDNLYNAGKVYDNFKFIKKKPQNPEFKGFYVSDNYVVNEIIDTIKKEEDNLFYFATTMQSHMPYVKEKYDYYHVEVKSSILNIQDQEVLLSYAEGINDASIELKRLYDYIQTINKKTIIIFIGDHLPYLNNNMGENVIDKLEYFNTKDNLINKYRRYNTEALVLSNFKIDFDDTKYLSPDLLIPYILNALNIKMTPYYNYLITESKKILPCYNKDVSVNNNGEIFYTSKLSGLMRKEYSLRENLQYHLYYAKK